MKKISIIVLLMFGILSTSIAQATSAGPKTSVSKQDKAAIAAQKKADKEAKALAKKQAKEAKLASPSNTTIAHLNKNGTPDKRFKDNNQPKVTTQAQTQSQPTTAVETKSHVAKVTRSTTHLARTNTATTPDKAISTDAEGRTIYQGPRGGKYYVNKNGNKEYVK